MRTLLSLAVILFAAPALFAQAAVQPADAGAPYTLHASSRVVLMDVSVTDRDGNPIHGLRADDFNVFDNKQAQQLSSFEEHTVAPAARPPEPQPAVPGTYTNAYLMHLPPVVNVLVLDVTHTRITDQMYLYYEMNRFLDQFPGDQPLAVFLRSSGCLLLQPFTADRTLLRAAVKRAIPRFPTLGGDFITDIDTLHEIALYLAPVPGRKNVLWFTSGSITSIDPDGKAMVNMRPVYDELEADRIAVYPLDVRGLTVTPAPGEALDHLQMADVGQATGGKATYNDNWLDVAALKLVDTDRSFYTLTYAPRDFQYDNRWHTVEVKLKGRQAQLSYRRGYFADAFNPAAAPPPPEGGTRTRLLRDGSRLKLPAETSGPIVFAARVAPEAADLGAPGLGAVDGQGAPLPPPRRGKQRMAIAYAVPVAALMLHQEAAGRHTAQVEISVEVLNHEGQRTGRRADRISMDVNTERLERNPAAVVRLRQLVDTGKGDEFLYLTVRDALSGRRGYVEIPLTGPDTP